MKRLWLGILLLLVLLASGILATWGMGRICAPLSESLDQAANAAQEGEWELALKFSDHARRRWEKWRNISAAVTNHEPMEEIDTLFGSMDIFARQRDVVRFADCCARLAALTDAIGESQAIYWWNVL